MTLSPTPATEAAIAAAIAEVHEAIEQAMGIHTIEQPDGTVTATGRPADNTRLRELYRTEFGRIAIDRFLAASGVPDSARAQLGLPLPASN